MPRALKTDKFYIYAAKKSGHRKNMRLLGAKSEDLTIQDLLDFLSEKSLSPSEVILPNNFVTYAKVV
jgi:hypothetical protein